MAIPESIGDSDSLHDNAYTLHAASAPQNANSSQSERNSLVSEHSSSTGSISVSIEESTPRTVPIITNAYDDDKLSTIVHLDHTMSHLSVPPLGDTPSLDDSRTTVSISTIEEEEGEIVFQMRQLDEYGNIPLPDHKCEMFWLPCNQTYSIDEFEDWEEHCRAHIRSFPPCRVKCPFANCSQTFEHANGDAAWTLRSFHIREQHWMEPQRDYKQKLCNQLLRCLWCDGVIDKALLKSLQAHGTAEVYTRSHGERNDRRREEARYLRAGR